jgi:hypothetical protein
MKNLIIGNPNGPMISMSVKNNHVYGASSITLGKIAILNSIKPFETKKCVCKSNVVLPTTNYNILGRVSISSDFVLNEIYDYSFAEIIINKNTKEKIIQVGANLAAFSIEDFNKFFMDISEYREKRIDEILND